MEFLKSNFTFPEFIRCLTVSITMGVLKFVTIRHHDVSLRCSLTLMSAPNATT